MRKKEILDIIIENKMSIFNRKDKDSNLIKFLSKNNINIPIEELSYQSIFDYLNNISDEFKLCEMEGCDNNKKFKGIDKRFVKTKGYTKFCSRECANNYLSITRMGENNPIYKMTNETKLRVAKDNSKRMKEKIRNGEFIPNITNSWANSRCEIEFIREGKLIKQKTRSTWEAYFQLKNINLLYEKLIIPYKYKGEERNYIVDFVDHKNKMIYEIKPLSNRNSKIVKTKEKYALKWCEENGYKLMFITDEWFENNYDESLVKGQPSEQKMIKNLKQFNSN